MGLATDKKIQNAKNTSTGLISINGDPLTLITDNMDGTININHDGIYEIVDRTDNNFTVARSTICKWVATNNIDHTADGDDGNFLVVVDIDQFISVIQLANRIPLLEVFVENDPDLNTHVQIGFLAKQSGLITNFTTQIMWNGNLHNRYKYLAQTLGVINSRTVPQDIIAVGGNLQLIYKAGQAFIVDNNFFDADGLSQDQNILVNDINPTLIILADRTGAFITFTFDVDVVNIESPVGTFVTMPNNNAALRFFAGFPTLGLIGSLLGQIPYQAGTPQASMQAAIDANEDPELPPFGVAGVNLIELASIKDETDLDNSIFKALPKFVN